MEGDRQSGQYLSQCRHLTAKYTLFLLNFLITVGGLCAIAVGIVAVKKVPKLMALADMTTDPAVSLLWIGGVMIVIGTMGCMGPLREHIILLKLFSASVVIIFLMLAIGGILTYFYVTKVRRNMTTYIIKSIAHYQDDSHLQDAVDYIQKRFSCCGATNYTDWEHNAYFNCSSPAQSSCGVPASCCKIHGNMWCGVKTRGFGEMYAAHTINTSGCVPHLVRTFRNHLLVVGAIALSVGVLELAGLVLAVFLLKNITILLKQQQQQQQQQEQLENNSYVLVEQRNSIPQHLTANNTNSNKDHHRHKRSRNKRDQRHKRHPGEESCLNGIESKGPKYTDNIDGNSHSLLHNSYRPP